MKKLRALFPASHWGSNIGNAFFNLGTQYLLESNGVEITYSDLPPTKAFGLTEKQRQNDIGYGYRIGQFDFLVLDGPMFDIRFGELFGPLLETAQKLGIRTLLLSTGGINYSPSEISHCREVLKKYPPYILTTRDAETYNNYNDLCEKSYNAICSAWFVPEAYPGYNIPDERPYITSCFDHTREPQFSLAFHTTQESPEFSTTRVTHSKLTKITRLLQRNLNDDINGIQIIRPCHQVLNRQNWRLFYKPNSYCSQLPHGYLNLYRNTKLTITDRLHASVATLAYGNPARLFIKSNRTLLLDRVNAQHVGNKVFKMDIDALSNEKEEYQNWLTKALHN